MTRQRLSFKGFHWKQWGMGVTGMVTLSFFWAMPLGAQELTPRPVDGSSMEVLGHDIQRVFMRGRAGVVRVWAESQVGMLSGTGFFVDDAGVVVTSSSLLVPGGRMWLETEDKERVAAQVVGVDREASVLVLRGNLRGNSLGWGDERGLFPGSLAVLTGFPFNQPAAPSLAVVAGLDGKSPKGGYFCTAHFRMALPLVPGCVGGPLLDGQARVVGMITGSMDQPGQTYALPAVPLRRVVEDLRAYGEVRRGWLGVTAEEGAGHAAGVVVESVVEGAPAQVAGVQAGDRVVKMGESEVRDGADVRRLSFLLRAGDTVRLVVERDGGRQQLTAAVAERPARSSLGLSGWARQFTLHPKEPTGGGAEVAMTGDGLR